MCWIDYRFQSCFISYWFLNRGNYHTPTTDVMDYLSSTFQIVLLNWKLHKNFTYVKILLYHNSSPSGHHQRDKWGQHQKSLVTTTSNVHPEDITNRRLHQKFTCGTSPKFHLGTLLKFHLKDISKSSCGGHHLEFTCSPSKTVIDFPSSIQIALLSTHKLLYWQE